MLFRPIADPMVPVLKTARLTLRAHMVTDFEESLRLWTDEQVTRYVTGRPSTVEEVWSRLLRYAGHWQLMGYGYWAVTETEGGAFVGEVGFADFRRTIEPPISGMPEAGWIIRRDRQGLGYGAEAVAAAHRWADRVFQDGPTVCIIAPGNTPSFRIAARLGYRETARTHYRGDPTVMLLRERPAPGEPPR